METTTRTNLTSLAKLKLEERDVTTLDQFRKFVEDLYDELCDFGKFEALSIRKEILEDVMKEEVEKVLEDLLEEARAMEDSVEELPDPEAMVTEDSVEEVDESDASKNVVPSDDEDDVLNYRRSK